MSTRKVIEQIKARPSSDGNGVKLLRVFGGAGPERFDPFLLLDEFGSERADDYIGGFPPHPHRGFSTITYMLEGKMEHTDHMDNVGLLEDGGVQWMTAGKGVIHSEMPKQTEGKMHGFQLWLNLPAANKMQTANYEDVPAEKLPNYTIGAIHVTAIAGEATINGDAVQGYFQVADTLPIYLDIHIPAGEDVTLALNDSLNALLYTYDGSVVIGDDETVSSAQTLSRLDRNGNVYLSNTGKETARLIFLAGQALEENVVQYGPFVMNTMEEIDQALQDYRAGTLTA